VRILVSRTDRIGDVVLTLPLCGLLKARLDARVIVLARGYTRPVVEAHDAVDEILDWDAVAGASRAEQARFLAAARADAILHVRPWHAISRAAHRARIPVRIGTTRRIHHWLHCTRLEGGGRRGSELHEAELNVRLARSLLADAAELPLAALVPYGRVTPRVAVPAEVAPLLAGDRFNLVIHPKSLGSAREWPLAAYRELAEALPAERWRVLVTGSADEGAALAGWLREMPPHVHDLCGRLALAELIAVVAAADGVVGASTGPVHLAAAAGARTLGLFSPVRPMHPGRWAPLGERAEVLVAPAACDACRDGEPEPGTVCSCMAAIPVADVRLRVEAWANELENGSHGFQRIGTETATAGERSIRPDPG
jgi:ADP-heptose:LPS heptosyltransferase